MLKRYKKPFGFYWLLSYYTGVQENLYSSISHLSERNRTTFSTVWKQLKTICQCVHCGWKNLNLSTYGVICSVLLNIFFSYSLLGLMWTALEGSIRNISGSGKTSPENLILLPLTKPLDCKSIKGSHNGFHYKSDSSHFLGATGTCPYVVNQVVRTWFDFHWTCYSLRGVEG